RARHAAAQRALDDEVERLQARQLVADHGAGGHVGEGPRDDRLGQLLAQDPPAGLVEGDDGDIGRIAFVAGPSMGQVMDAHHVRNSRRVTWGSTWPRGIRPDCTASTSLTTGSEPPAPPAGPLTCSARVSKPTASAALRSA